MENCFWIGSLNFGYSWLGCAQERLKTGHYDTTPVDWGGGPYLWQQWTTEQTHIDQWCTLYDQTKAGMFIQTDNEKRTERKSQELLVCVSLAPTWQPTRTALHSFSVLSYHPVSLTSWPIARFDTSSVLCICVQIARHWTAVFVHLEWQELLT